MQPKLLSLGATGLTGRELPARLMRLMVRPRSIATRVTRLHAWLLRHSRGRFRRSWIFAFGRPVAALTTTGRRSGQPRSTPVTWFRDGADIITVAMYVGMERDPDWCLNLEANPEAVILVEGRRVNVRARRTTGDDRKHLWARWLEIQPISERFEPLAQREIPIFRLTPLTNHHEIRPQSGGEASRPAGRISAPAS